MCENISIHLRWWPEHAIEAFWPGVGSTADLDGRVCWGLRESGKGWGICLSPCKGAEKLCNLKDSERVFRLESNGRWHHQQNFCMFKRAQLDGHPWTPDARYSKVCCTANKRADSVESKLCGELCLLEKNMEERGFLLCKSKFPFLLEWGRRFFVISCHENNRGKDFLFSFPMAAWPLLNESVALYIPVCRLPGTELRSSYIERCEALLAIPHALMGLESGQRIGNRFLWMGWPIVFGDNRQRNDWKDSCWYPRNGLRSLTKGKWGLYFLTCDLNSIGQPQDGLFQRVVKLSNHRYRRKVMDQAVKAFDGDFEIPLTWSL